jgi:hypothetical protein
VYFDNDVKVMAPFDALAVMRALGLAWRPCAAGAGLPCHVPGARLPRLRAVHGTRVTGGAWDGLRRAQVASPRAARP